MMAHNEPLTRQVQLAYEAALRSQCPDWRSVAELFRAALRSDSKRAPKRSQAPRKAQDEMPDYSVDRLRLKCRSARIAVRFMDGEAVFTHVPSAPSKPLNIGRALRVAIAMYRSRRAVQQRLGFREYDRAMPVPEIFQVRCLETDELFDVEVCNKHTLEDRDRNDPERASEMPRTREAAQGKLGDGQATGGEGRGRRERSENGSQVMLLGQLLGHKNRVQKTNRYFNNLLVLVAEGVGFELN